MNRILTILVLMSLTFGVNAQRKNRKSSASTTTTATPANERFEGYEKRMKLADRSLVKQLEFKNIGPTVMSGRVVDFDVNPTDPSHFYVAFASGGLWETKNHGASFDPLFDTEIVMTIGDIAVDWDNQIIYVGSGENNSSRSSYAGYGMFKSTNNGDNWTHIGLEESHHIGRIILHPSDENVMWISVLGHLYSKSAERGVYKTEDGGKSWKRVLFSNDRAGGIELVQDPSNENTLYAALWERERSAWDFKGAGEGSGLYKSTDGGDSWGKISGGDSGFPDTNGTGRVGMALAPSNPDVLYAVLDNQDRKDKEESEDEGLTKDKLRNMSKDNFLQLEDSVLTEFLSKNRFPKKYSAESVKSSVESGKVLPIALTEYLEDANALLFDTPVIGSEVYRSEDGGATWSKTHEGYLEDLFYSYGYYFAQISIDAQDPNKIYTMGVPIIKSSDGGKTWSNINKSNVHVDHHALWVNPDRSGHLINGNDGGVNISFDDGEHWTKCNTLPVAQFYDVNVDMSTPYNIYGGLQDNGVWVGPSNYNTERPWSDEASYSWQELLGGDGMQVEVDTRDNNTIYTGFQFGNYYRINKLTGKTKRITPIHELGERPLRWNWETPVHLSRHNQDVLYMGSNKFHRSMNQGDSFETLSGDLTKGGRKGNVSYGTMTSIVESPMRFGLIYVGTDDGYIHVSQNVGHSWERISGALPADMWVSSVVPSSHKEGRVYASLNGYRWDNFEALVYMSDDFGKNWRKIGLDLPSEPVNVIVEDDTNADVLYVGTDHGVYVSIDGGDSFMAFGASLPNVPVHDIVIQPREKDLIIGTHGRSVYVADIEEIQQLTDDVLSKSLYVFKQESVNYSENWGDYRFSRWFGFNDDSQKIAFYSSTSGTGKVIVKSKDSTLFEMDLDISKGLNYYGYDFTMNQDLSDKKKKENGKVYLTSGEYEVVIQVGANEDSGTLSIKPLK